MTKQSSVFRRRSLATVAALVLMALPAVTKAALAQNETTQPHGDEASSSLKPPVPAPKSLVPLAAKQSSGVLGSKVISASNENLGMIVDVIVDAGGRPQAAVIDFGGFLGVGSRKVAVDWSLLRFDPGGRDRRVTLSADRAEIQNAPEYKPDAAVTEVVAPPLADPPLPDDTSR